ncbi:hypothetical protein M23134_01386 [Microscilla marina ATCC 23134]|uniref:Uncharacterized protein n=1 Tax=Microscilla marina ATCC 23134 TaxID=313606 RepID=A1ZJM7_MICM2|nr:hypothetical protein M23134_01386 [Microscilla marina ATCC 23134]
MRNKHQSSLVTSYNDEKQEGTTIAIKKYTPLYNKHKGTDLI